MTYILIGFVTIGVVFGIHEFLCNKFGWQNVDDSIDMILLGGGVITFSLGSLWVIGFIIKAIYEAIK